MALLRCDFFSETLTLSTSMTVILPQNAEGQIGLDGKARRSGHPVLYLLHGLSDDDTIWSRRTSIERYAADLGLAVVMPNVHRSFYTDQAYGGRFWTFLSEELPAVVSSFFAVSTAREDTFVAGLSMGGYGALKWALRQPARFAAAASLSGVTDIGGRYRRAEQDRTLGLVFDADPTGGDDDLFALTTGPEGLPALYVCCGTEDRLYPENRRYVSHCEEVGVPLTTDFGPGDHEWGYWDRTIQDVLAWLPLTTR